MAPGAGEDFSGYRRRIRVSPASAMVDVEMEDDAHHFGVTIHHDGVSIARVETREPRHPWTTCPAAGVFLRQKAAGALLADAAAIDDQRQHCTHMFDLFVLGAAHAHDEAPLTYDIRVSDPVDGVRLCEIDRNGETLLQYRLDGDPADGAIPGGSYRELGPWSRTLADALQEAARMLRRGVLVARGRGLNFPAGQSAVALLGVMQGACFSFQPERAREAISLKDTARDFSRNPEKMLTGECDDRRSEEHPRR